MLHNKSKSLRKQTINKSSRIKLSSRRALSTTPHLKSSKKTHQHLPTPLHTIPSRSMAFSFDRPTSMFQLPQQSTAPSWNKHSNGITIRSQTQIRQEQEELELAEQKQQKKEKQSEHLVDPPSDTPVDFIEHDADIQRRLIEQQRFHSRQLSKVALSPKENKFSFGRNQHSHFSRQGSLVDHSITEDLPSRSNRPFDTSQSSPQTPEQIQLEFQQKQQYRVTPPPEVLSQSRFSLTNVLQNTTNAIKRSDVSGTSLTDLDVLFKHSPLSGIFAQQQIGPTFWSHTSDGDVLHFIGTRQIIDQSGQKPDPTYAFLQRKISKRMRQFNDTFTTYNYQTQKPSISQIITNLEPELNKGTVKDRSAQNDDIAIRTALRLRGVGWKWHSGVMMTRIEQVVYDTNKPKPPDVYNVTRIKYKERGFTSEKIIRQNDTLIGTVIDEMKIVSQKEFEDKLANCIQGSPSSNISKH